MDKATLVKDDISDGKKLIQHLDNTEFKVNSALWFYATDLNEWKLVLASEYLKAHGLKEAYSFVQNELEKLYLTNISLNNIAITGANDQLIELLKRGIVTGSKDISDIRFTRNVINGVMIEDALIYRLT
ncbi:MAG: hypothetical protein AAGU10_16010 [Methanosarcina mazei]|uniref:hypothetical protein n=1 Tax=Methanosarcina soligelidi TaxID=1036677 RepID=UPI00064EA6DA|nr:hypothetical protein [Methanosarcina soligelidi]